MIKDILTIPCQIGDHSSCLCDYEKVGDYAFGGHCTCHCHKSIGEQLQDTMNDLTENDLTFKQRMYLIKTICELFAASVERE